MIDHGRHRHHDDHQHLTASKSGASKVGRSQRRRDPLRGRQPRPSPTSTSTTTRRACLANVRDGTGNDHHQPRGVRASTATDQAQPQSSTSIRSSRLKITNSYIHDAIVGHEIKIRAQTNTITDNRILDNAGSPQLQHRPPERRQRRHRRQLDPAGRERPRTRT